jgi:hypothetical protein
MQNKDTAKKLADAIEQAQERLAAAGRFSPSQVARSAIESMEREFPVERATFRDSLELTAVTGMVRRRIERTVRATDTRHGWLDFPEYSAIPALIQVSPGTVIDLNEATLDQYRASEGELRHKIKSYDYPRRAREKLRRDRQSYTQMRRLERRVVPYFIGAPRDMRMGQAVGLYLGSLETPRAQRDRKGGKARHRLQPGIKRLG